jgi:hypothetical protein
MPPPEQHLSHSDITVTLDEIFAKGDIGKVGMNAVSDCWKKISKGDAKHIGAKGIFYMLQTRRPNHIQSKSFGTTPGAQFPEATKSAWQTMNVTAIVDIATLQRDLNVDFQNAKKDLKQMPAKNTNFIKDEMKSIIEFYGVTKSRQLWQDRTNELARVSAINTSTRVVTCNNAGNLFNVQNLEAGQPAEVRDGSGTLRGYLGIESVYKPTKTFKIDANYILDASGATATLSSLGITNGDRIYPKDGYNQGIQGVPTMIGVSGAFQSLADRTFNSDMTGVELDATGRALSWSMLQRLNTAQRFRRNGKKTKGVFYASSQLDALSSLGLATQGFGQKTSLDMGFTENDMSFNGMTFHFDQYVPRDEFYKVDLSEIDYFSLRDFEPIRQGDTYEFLAPGVDRHYAKNNIYLLGIMNLGCEIPAAVGAKIKGLSTAGLALGDD